MVNGLLVGSTEKEPISSPMVTNMWVTTKEGDLMARVSMSGLIAASTKENS